MSVERRFRCVLIGTGSVLTQCGEVLRRRGHEVVAAASPDSRVITWAREAGIAAARDYAALRALTPETPDLLLSIVNDEVLPAEALSWPTHLAVNYHDGPLPRYAGIHATSWAILGGESSHAVSWHVMSDRVDFGDILRQEVFSISEGDTAFTLNAKAYEAALRSFDVLLGDLERGKETRRAQSSAERTYFGRHYRPARAGILDWSLAAGELLRVVRALDFGAYDNRLCAARVWTGSRFLIASSAERTDTGPNSTPGTIIAVGDRSLRVSTGGESDLRVMGLREIDGTLADLSDARFACARRLPVLDGEDLRDVVALDAATHRWEAWWGDRLANLRPVQTPFVGSRQMRGDGESPEFHSHEIPTAAGMPVESQIAAFALYLARVGRSGRFDLPLHTSAQPKVGSVAGQVFETHVPLRVDLDVETSCAGIESAIAAELKELAQRPTYARDLAARLVRLRETPELRIRHVWQAGIEVGDSPTGRSAITLMPSAAGCRLYLRSDVISAEQGAEIAAQFTECVSDFTRDSTKAGSRVNMLTRAERRRVLETFAGPVREYERGLTLGDLVARQVASRPDAPAVVFEGRTVSYAELDAMSNRIAHRLQALGVRPGSLVGVCLHRSVELVAALVGVVKSGGAYVPLDPTYPAHRLSNMMEDADLAVLITSGEANAAVSGAAWRGPMIDVLDSAISDSPTIAPATSATERDTAYVIFTSGSTGRPKGAANAHAGIVNRLMWMQEYYGLGPGDRVLQKTPYSFDVSVWEFFWPLMTGATIVAAKPEGHRDSAYLVDLIAREGVTVLHFVPSMLRVFMEERNVSECTSIRRVVCSGEALPFDLVERFFARLPRAKLANLYGPTEAAVDVTAWECSPGDPRGIVPIGKAVPNTWMYVLDDAGAPTPVGVPGEIFIGGVQVGLGYVGRPDLTADRFVQNPFRVGERMYRTGDLGRWLPDGSIEYLGRLDDQVKIRGFRIELGEIESVLASQDGVREAVVLAREDVPGSQRIVAYVVGSASPAELREALAAVLPEYMVPSAFVMLEALPVTANGKLDRRALPAPPRGTGSKRGGEFVEAVGDVERALAEIWARVLGAGRVSVEDNFFEIGGDSILALRIVAAARDAGLTLAVHDLFGSPTVRALAQVAGSSGTSAVRAEAFDLISASDRAKLPPDVIDAYPLSALQNGMVFHSERSIGSYLYQVAMSLHVKARLDLDALRRAVDEVAARHPILRTSFDLGAYSEPMQLVRASATAPIDVEDLSHLSPEMQREVLAKWIDDEAEFEFDWSRPPLLKFTVHRRSAETFQFGITFHDAILDGWSTSNMVTEIFTRYAALLAGEPGPDMSPNPVTYRDFVALERSTLSSEQAKAFWADLMADAPLTQVPRLPGVGRDVTVARNLDLIVPVPAEVNQRVLERAKEIGVPVKALYLAAHMRVLGMVANQDDVVTGLVMNGRLESIGGDTCLGNHLNTMPYRLRVGGRTWAELAREAHEAESAALPHRRYVGAQLLRDLGRAGQDNLFETGFNYTHFHVYDRLSGREDVEFLRVDFTDPFHYVLVANFRVDAFDRRLDVVLNYNTRHMTIEQVKQIGRYYLGALRAIAENPGQAASTETMMPRSERRRILEDFAGERRDEHEGLTLDELVSRQVRATPDAPAIIFEDAVMTYAELDAAANRLANRLVESGAGRGSLVGVCLERSTELVWALLGVIRAGAAYVPLDPTYPAQRLNHMMEDAGIAVLVTGGATRSSSANEAIAAWTGPTVDVNDPRLALMSARPPEVAITPDDPAYAIFTSGSTGTPKAALNSHRGIVNRLMWMQDYYGLTAADRVLQKTPYSFDVSVWEFFWPLVTGTGIVVARPEGHRDPVYLAQVIERQAVTVMHFVPSMLRAFLEEPGVGRITSLRRVVCSGEALPPDLVQRFFAVLPAVRLANLYGPTEAAVDVTAWECAPNDPRGIVPIGRATPNTRMLVLDSRLELCPIGTPGELFIAGVQVGMGYVNRAELTSQRFIADPSRPGERMYRTGDVGRWLSDGSIEFLGRIDDQVKIRGFRIELGEIQHALASQEGVKQAVVAAREDVPGTPRLVGYVVGTADHATLRAALARTLPDYMIPAAFVTLDALPVNANGKLDRKALPAPSRASDSPSTDHRGAAVSDVESALAEIWGEVLRLETVGLSDDFFQIGGDSILSIQICARARRRGILITPNQLFEYPTIASLAPHARHAGVASADQRPVVGESPLVPIQKWLLDQGLVEPSHWNAAIMLEAPPSIDDLTYRRALAAVIEHHDALRLRFERTGTEWTQRFDPPEALNMIFHTALVDQFESPEAQASIERHGAAVQSGFDLAKGPVFGAVLFRERKGGGARLLMAAHHLVLDGFSWRLILEDVVLACDQIAGGAAPSLPSKTHSLRDWAMALKRHAAVVAGSPHEREWWLRELACSPRIPMDDSSGENIESTTVVRTMTLDREASRALLHDVPGAYRAQMNDILLAALGMALREWVDESALRIDMMGHGREAIDEDLDVSRTVGWLTTLYPVALPIGAMTDPWSAVSAARDHLRGVPRRGLGFGLLRSWDESDLGSRIRDAEPASISFNYLGQFDQSLSPGWSLRIARASCGPTRHPANPRPALIEIDAMIVDGMLRVDWSASGSVHRPGTIESLSDGFVSAMMRIIEEASSEGAVSAVSAATAFPLSGLDDEGLAKLSALFDASEFTDD